MQSSILMLWYSCGHHDARTVLIIISISQIGKMRLKWISSWEFKTSKWQTGRIWNWVHESPDPVSFITELINFHLQIFTLGLLGPGLHQAAFSNTRDFFVVFAFGFKIRWQCSSELKGFHITSRSDQPHPHSPGQSPRPQIAGASLLLMPKNSQWW